MMRAVVSDHLPSRSIDSQTGRIGLQPNDAAMQAAGLLISSSRVSAP
jgi:hypothetical protein